MSDAARGAIPARGNGRALAGFLLSGFLLALLGAILPAWGYHRDSAGFATAGTYFLVTGVGLVAATAFTRRMIERKGVPFLLVSACVLASLALAFLALVSPPAAAGWRMAGLFMLGLAAGFLNIALFHVLSASFQADSAGTIVIGGIWYGLGCLAATLLVAGTFYAYTVPAILLFMAAVPALFAALYLKSGYTAVARGGHPGLEQVLRDFRTPGAVMFALLLFFQFGNEWSIAGWLPVFLIRRVGLSPSGALLVLALYWTALLAGRLAAIAILPRVRHGRLLLGSGMAALFGCLILFSTNNWFGASTAVVFIGGGYASTYPLVAEAIGRRFPYYHPGFFNGIFSFALAGGLLAPATLGYAAAAFGVGVVIGIPLIGTFIVAVLVLLIWLETKVTGR